MALVKAKRQIILIVHNVRSSHNVGSLLRTAEGLGVKRIYLTGYTPYPITPNDPRLPHITHKATKAISKTALGAEISADWQQTTDIESLISRLKSDGFEVWALEQSPNSIMLPDWDAPAKCAIIVGREVEGLEPEVLGRCDGVVEIPMLGKKESFNVAQAAAMTLYRCRYS